MTLETRASLAALLAGLAVVGASYGVSALVAPRLAHEGAAPQSKASGQNSLLSPAQLITSGRGLYALACASCHGDNAQGGFGPGLRGLGQSDAQVGAVIKNGVQGRMPAFGGKYNGAQQQALVAYIQSLQSLKK